MAVHLLYGVEETPDGVSSCAWSAHMEALVAEAMALLDATPAMRLFPEHALRFARFGVVGGRHCATMFPGLEPVYGAPHYADAHYHVIAHRCGYGDDLFKYCVEHEFLHSFVSERLHGRPSQVMVSLATNKEIAPGIAAEEEIVTQAFQTWVRSGQEPIVGGVDWRGLKEEALSFLGP